MIQPNPAIKFEKDEWEMYRLYFLVEPVYLDGNRFLNRYYKGELRQAKKTLKSMIAKGIIVWSGFEDKEYLTYNPFKKGINRSFAIINRNAELIRKENQQ